MKKTVTVSFWVCAFIVAIPAKAIDLKSVFGEPYRVALVGTAVTAVFTYAKDWGQYFLINDALPKDDRANVLLGIGFAELISGGAVLWAGQNKDRELDYRARKSLIMCGAGAMLALVGSRDINMAMSSGMSKGRYDNPNTWISDQAANLIFPWLTIFVAPWLGVAFRGEQFEPVEADIPMH